MTGVVMSMQQPHCYENAIITKPSNNEDKITKFKISVMILKTLTPKSHFHA